MNDRARRAVKVLGWVATILCWLGGAIGVLCLNHDDLKDAPIWWTAVTLTWFTIVYLVALRLLGVKK